MELVEIAPIWQPRCTCWRHGRWYGWDGRHGHVTSPVLLFSLPEAPGRCCKGLPTGDLGHGAALAPRPETSCCVGLRYCRLTKRPPSQEKTPCRETGRGFFVDVAESVKIYTKQTSGGNHAHPAPPSSTLPERK